MKFVAFSAAATGVMTHSFATVAVAIAIAKITVGSTETHVDWEF
jgi:hypothetical protein